LTCLAGLSRLGAVGCFTLCGGYGWAHHGDSMPVNTDAPVQVVLNGGESDGCPAARPQVERLS